MNIQEVSEIFSACRFLRAPTHVFITDERVCDEASGSCFRGLQPKKRGDAIFLSAEADVTTIPHEAWHAQTSLGEPTAYPIGNLVAKKYQAFKRFPNLMKVMGRSIKYRDATYEETVKEFPGAANYVGRLKHYVLEE